MVAPYFRYCLFTMFFLFVASYCHAQVIPQTNWRLVYVDSQELVGENGAATNAFDGNTATIWHTKWYNVTPAPAPPHEIQIDLGGVYSIGGFRYLPRQDGSQNGWIGQYEFYVSTDGTNWGTAVATGTFAKNATEKQVVFTALTGRYVRLRALTEINGKAWTSAAEINVLGSALTNQAPNGTITAPATDTTISVGGTVSFSGTGTDPDGNTPLQFNWNFGSGSGVAPSSAQNPGSVQFNTAGTFTVTFTVTDALGLADPTPATRTITVQAAQSGVIPQTNWRLVYVDSQELVGENDAATNAFDGNTATIWHTKWYNVTPAPAPPHEIQIDLGGVYSIGGFRYLPRQDGSQNGWIGQYEFYVSTDGTNWGTAVATGTFAKNATEKQVVFTALTGRYVRLRALTEINGKAWTSAAEINVLGSALTNQAPNGTITAPATDTTISVGGTVSFSGTGTDPDGNTPLQFNWNFGSGSGVAPSSAQNPGSVQFNTAGTFTVTFTVTDALGLADPTPATRTITVQAANQAPNGTITAPATDTTISVGGTVSFSGTGTDPDGNTPLQFNWNFGSGSGVAPSSAQNPGSVQFNTAGTFTVTFTVTDALGLADPTPATRTITVQAAQSGVIPQTNWRLVYVDSQELVRENDAATNAFDGNAATIWHTGYTVTPAPRPPHEIQIDLGRMYSIGGFRYLPRQDGSQNGWIGQYEFYVSTDGTNWGTAVATGTFAKNATEKQVVFTALTGQYVRLRALTEINGQAWTSAAEINVLGTCLTPSVQITQPPFDRYLQPSQTLVVQTSPCLDPATQQGWGVKVVLDGGTAQDVYTPPFSATFTNVSKAEHVVDAFIINNLGAIITGNLTHYQTSPIGIGDYYVAMGDSITAGSHDDISSDNISRDGRQRTGGYPPILNNLLTAAKGYPQTIVNEGIPGDTSNDGVVLIPDLLAQHPNAQRFLVLYGTNDAMLSIPSGRGLVPGDAGYAGSYKDNMQQIITEINNAGKTVALAKIPPLLPLTDPVNNLIQEYNQVIDELRLLNNLTVPSPDLYAEFTANATTEYSIDGVHPNGIGYQAIANRWYQVLSQ